MKPNEIDEMSCMGLYAMCYGPDASCRDFVCEIEEYECVWRQIQIAINREWVEKENCGDLSNVL